MMSLGNSGKAMQVMTLEPEYRLKSSKRTRKKIHDAKVYFPGVFFL